MAHHDFKNELDASLLVHIKNIMFSNDNLESVSKNHSLIK